MGIDIKEHINLNNIEVGLGEREVIVIVSDPFEGVTLIEYFSVLSYFFKFHETKTVFGLMAQPGQIFSRKKIKDHFIKNFSPENLLTLVGGNRAGVYYSEKEIIHQFMGIEIRYEGTFKRFEKEEVYLDLIQGIRAEKKKTFSKHEKR